MSRKILILFLSSLHSKIKILLPPEVKWKKPHLFHILHYSVYCHQADVLLYYLTLIILLNLS